MISAPSSCGIYIFLCPKTKGKCKEFFLYETVTTLYELATCCVAHQSVTTQVTSNGHVFELMLVHGPLIL